MKKIRLQKICAFLRKSSRPFCKWAGLPLAAILLFAVYANITVSASEEKVFSEIAETPKHKVGLLLGTGKFINGSKNPYYENRIAAAAALYKSGKIEKILASGDGSSFKNCEPEQMRGDLVALGVEEKDITLDYAGFRTLDSVLRCKKVFGVSDPLIISQDFHCMRALFIAQRSGMKAGAFAARDVPRKGWKRRMALREFMARTVAVADTDIVGRDAKFYGKPVRIRKD